ncbi:hypothetical protein L7F22_057626 [Adiantum nelumboides]|nr:hypothetical protein [Adiantum nelumboides]
MRPPPMSMCEQQQQPQQHQPIQILRQSIYAPVPQPTTEVPPLPHDGVEQEMNVISREDKGEEKIMEAEAMPGKQATVAKEPRKMTTNDGANKKEKKRKKKASMMRRKIGIIDFPVKSKPHNLIEQVQRQEHKLTWPQLLHLSPRMRRQWSKMVSTRRSKSVNTLKAQVLEDDVPVLDTQIKGQRVSSDYVDEGAQMCVISEKRMHKLGLEVSGPSGLKGNDVSVNNTTNSHGSSASGKSLVPNASTGSNLFGNLSDKGKKKMRCHYCKANDHLIKECPKLKAKEAEKKEVGSSANAGSFINATIVESSMKRYYDVDVDAEWAFSAECIYNLGAHDAHMMLPFLQANDEDIVKAVYEKLGLRETLHEVEVVEGEALQLPNTQGELCKEPVQEKKISILETPKFEDLDEQSYLKGLSSDVHLVNAITNCICYDDSKECEIDAIFVFHAEFYDVEIQRYPMKPIQIDEQNPIQINEQKHILINEQKPIQGVFHEVSFAHSIESGQDASSAMEDKQLMDFLDDDLEWFLFSSTIFSSQHSEVCDLKPCTNENDSKLMQMLDEVLKDFRPFLRQDVIPREVGNATEP